LPKFLAGDSTIEYVETIIDVITCIKLSGKFHPLTKVDEIILAYSSYWIRDAFKKNYELIGQKCSLNAIYILADKLKKVLEHKQKKNSGKIEIGEDVYHIEVSRVPAEKLKAGEIGFQDGQFQCVVKQFSRQQLQDVGGDHSYWALYKTEPQIEVKQFSFTAMRQEAFLKTIIENLPRDIEWTKSTNFDEKLKYIFKGLHADYSEIWLKSIASGGQDYERDAEEVLAIILRDILLAKCEANKSEGKKILCSFLSDHYQFPIFRRFVLLCIDKYWINFYDLFDKFFEIVPTALEESAYEVELYDILVNHNQEFNLGLRTNLKELIDNVPAYYVKEGEKLTEYWKYKWLSPLRHNPDFSALYEKAKQKTEPKDGKPYEPRRLSFEAGVVSHKSPISKEEILEMPVSEFVKYLSEFKGADFWRGAFDGEPDKEGLAEAFHAAVKENPKKFTDEIDAFWGVDYFYLHKGLFWGFREAWTAKNELDWEKIFNFILKYFKRNKECILKEAFQAQGNDSGEGKYIYLVDDVVGLIADGCRDDARAFDLKYFDKANQIFELVLPLLKGEKNPDTQRDALSYAMNTTLGKTIEAYISFALRATGATKEKEENWGEIKFERFFTKGGIEAYIWFGCYLPQMKYLDEKYTEEKIKLFALKKADDFKWQMFMEGYLFAHKVYPDLYSLMRAHYIMALENKIFEERIDRRLVSHIALGYLYYGESLQEKNPDGNSSLFWKMLTEAGARGKSDRWLEIAGFFWSEGEGMVRKTKKDVEGKSSEEIKKKILDFWCWTYNQQKLAEENLGDRYNAFLERMAKLTIFLDSIDEENEKWLLLCAPHVARQYDEMFFIESLTKFEDLESIKRIGKIFWQVLENATPTFKQENIELIVRRIFEVAPNIAEDICNIYGRRGVHFLRPIWEEYQKKKY